MKDDQFFNKIQEIESEFINFNNCKGKQEPQSWRSSNN